MKRLAIAAALACAGLTPSPAQAHDYWLSPAVLVSKRPATVPVSLFVGESFVAEDEKPYAAARTVLLQHWTTSGNEDLAPRAVEGAKPAFSFEARGSGGHLIVLERNAARIEMTAAKFEAYLREEGLAAIIDERKRLGESEKPGRERYTRYLKALVQIGDARDDNYAHGPPQTLAIVPQENPVFVEPGKPLRFVIFFQGQPLPGATVEAIDRVGSRVEKASVKTGADGAAQVTLHGDAHLLRMVHMTRCEGCDDADWQSFWSSYTFGSAGGGPVELSPRTRDAVPPTAVPPGGCGCGLSGHSTTTPAPILLALAVLARRKRSWPLNAEAR